MPGSLIPRDGFIHNIREKNSPVKPKFENVTESQQFKRWFGDWKRSPRKASKVVNADGTPKVSKAQQEHFKDSKVRNENAQYIPDSGCTGRFLWIWKNENRQKESEQLLS